MNTSLGQDRLEPNEPSAQRNLRPSVDRLNESAMRPDLEAETDLANVDASLTWRTAKALKRQCNRLLLAEPDNLVALEMLAKCQWRLNEYAEVVRTTHRLLKLNAFEPGYLLLRALSRWALGQSGAAVEDLLRAKHDSSDPAFLSHVDHALAELESYQGELVLELLKIDEAFARQYAMDPIAACREKGFEFSWHREQAVRPAIGADVAAITSSIVPS